MDDYPPDATLPVVVWRNVGVDLRAVADAIDAQLSAFAPELDEDSFLTLRFPEPAIHTALEYVVRAQIGDDAFEEIMSALYDDEEALED